eukprot:6096581-Amphidinium_carterae.1
MPTDYTKENDIGKAIIEQYFSKMRLTAKEPSHQLWANNNHQTLNNKTNNKKNTSQQQHITTTDPDT